MPPRFPTTSPPACGTPSGTPHGASQSSTWSNPTPDTRRPTPDGSLPRTPHHAHRPTAVSRARALAGAVAGRGLRRRAARRVRPPAVLHESAQPDPPHDSRVPREHQEAGPRLGPGALRLRAADRGDLALVLTRAGAAPRGVRLLPDLAALRG